MADIVNEIKSAGKFSALVALLIAAPASIANSSSEQQLELIDGFLTFSLFSGAVGLSIAASTLVFALQQQLEVKISTISTDVAKIKPTAESRATKLSNSVHYFLRSLYLATAGLATSVAFDGVFEYYPPNRVEGNSTELVLSSGNEQWVDIAEAGGSGGLLLGFLCFFSLGIRIFTSAHFQSISTE